MPLIVNSIGIENVLVNGVALSNVLVNGTEVWKAKVDAIVNSALPAGVSLTTIYEYCNYGEWSAGGTIISGTSIRIDCSDYYQASRYYMGRVRVDGISFVGRGQTITITNTYYNKQIADDSDNDHKYAYANLYAYNLSTGALTALGNIRYDGTKTFSAPADGATYTLCIEMSTWAGKPYDTNTATLAISQLVIG